VWIFGMKVSIITATYNSANTLLDTIHSVNMQNYFDIEHVFVDGASLDDTLSLIKKFSSRESCIVSEPDHGIYDAMNKGIELATGDIIAILNSDDFYVDDDVVSAVVNTFNREGCDIVIANSYHVSGFDKKKIVQAIRIPINNGYIVSKGYLEGISLIDGMIYHGVVPPHTSFFVRKSVYQAFGLFDLSCGISADLDLMFRFIVDKRIDCGYLDKYVVYMREGGASTKSIIRLIMNLIDSANIIRKHGYDVGMLYYLRRVYAKVLQRLNLVGAIKWFLPCTVCIVL